VVRYFLKNYLNTPVFTQRCRSETEKKMFYKIFSNHYCHHWKKYHPPGSLKFNYLGIPHCLKLRISKGKFLSIILNLNFTRNTLGCYRLILFTHVLLNFRFNLIFLAGRICWNRLSSGFLTFRVWRLELPMTGVIATVWLYRRRSCLENFSLSDEEWVTWVFSERCSDPKMSSHDAPTHIIAKIDLGVTGASLTEPIRRLRCGMRPHAVEM